MVDKSLQTAFIMKDRNRFLLSTRPLSKSLVDEALKQSITIECVSFIETENIINQSISDKIRELASTSITAVFTSMNGAAAVINDLQKNALQPTWKIYSLGAATESLIRKYFSSSEITGSGKNAFELAQTIIGDKVEEVIFFCGDQRRDELPLQLQKNNISVKEIMVYET